MDDEEAALTDHTAELRRRLIHTTLWFVAATAILFPASSPLLTWLQNDLALQLHALAAYEVIYTQLNLAITLGLIATLPVLLLQALLFAKPGLKSHEYRVMRNMLPASLVLFLAGSIFAYHVIIRNVFTFFQQTTRAADITAVWGLQNTIGFAIKLSALTGILFQVPVVAAVLGRAGIVTAPQMRRYRVHVFIGVLALSAVATPPDVVSQVIVTAPVMGLYEASIRLVAWIAPTAPRD